MNPIQIKLSDRVTRDEIDNLVQQIVEPVLSGDAEALPVYVRAKLFSKIASQIIEQIDPIAIDEASRYETKSFDFQNCNLTRKDGADSPDVSLDAEVQRLNALLKERTELLKHAYKMNGKAVIYDPNTGEEIPVLPAKPTKPFLTLNVKL
jgi:hypothetical protein